jgi:serine palmitoyltransferase
VFKYIKNSYQNDPFRTVLEIFLVIFLFWYFSKSRSEDSSKIKLSEQEIQELIDEWEPEPLVAELSEIQKFELDKIPVVHGPVGLKVKLADVS